ncbi:MAG: response regulator [bacterium]
MYCKLFSNKILIFIVLVIILLMFNCMVSENCQVNKGYYEKNVIGDSESSNRYSDSSINNNSPFWQTHWFIGLMFLLIVGVAYGIYFYKMKYFDVQTSELHDGVEEKAAGLEALNKILKKEIQRRKQTEVELKKQAKDLQLAKEKEEQNTSRLFHMIEELDIAKRKAEAATHTKSEFLANMSHEIRTPMNGIIGMTELALESESDQDRKEYLEGVKASADLLMVIINDILDFSKIEAGKLEMESLPFRLRDKIGEIVQAFSAKASEKGLELVVHVLPDVPDRLIGDPHRLGQIVINLINNAIKFTKEGEIILRIDSEENEENYTKLHFMVQDTGIGVSPDKQKHIFEVFEQADGSTTRKYGGSGLGLAISSKLVDLMEGDIWVESPVKESNTSIGGPGSIFHFTAKYKKQLGKKSKSSEIFEIFKNRNVFIIDDNKTNRIVLKEMVYSLGMIPTLNASCKYGLKTLAQDFKKGKKYSIVLCDFNIPEMDGLEFTEELRKDKRFAKLPVIILTSADRPEKNMQKKDLGISNFLLKPVKKSNLIKAMMYELNSKQKAEVDSFKQSHKKKLSSRSNNIPQNLKILLAEDNPINSKVIQTLLRKKGWEVSQVGNGKQAFEKVKQNSYDIIFMDVQMPQMDGFESTKLIREYEKEKGSHTPIIALTARAMAQDREKCISAGMDEYISKPVKSEDVYKIVNKVINDSGLQSKKVSPKIDHSVNTKAVKIDMKNLLGRLDGDKDLLDEIVESFIEEYPRKVIELRKLIQTGKTETLKEKAHSFKGAISNFGVQKAYDLALKLEKMESDFDKEESLRILQELEQQLHLIKEFFCLQDRQCVNV